MGVPAYLLTHTIGIEAYGGADSSGVEHYAPPVIVACFLDQKLRRVTAPTGDEVLSSSTAYAALSAELSAPVGSRVTLPDGTVTRVIEALKRDGGGLPTPDHLEIILT